MNFSLLLISYQLFNCLQPFLMACADRNSRGLRNSFQIRFQQYAVLLSLKRPLRVDQKFILIGCFLCSRFIFSVYAFIMYRFYAEPNEFISPLSLSLSIFNRMKGLISCCTEECTIYYFSDHNRVENNYSQEFANGSK